MKNNILKLSILLTIVIFCYMIRSYNSFIFLILGLLYIIFSNSLTLINLDNDKNLFVISFKSIIILNFIFFIINIIIGLILNKIFYLKYTIELFTVFSLTYPLNAIINIIREYLKLNNYKKLYNLIYPFFTYLNIFIFLIFSYLFLKLFSIDLSIVIIIILLSLIIADYSFISFLLIFIRKKITSYNCNNYKKIINIIRRKYSTYLVNNYNYFIIYISVVYLFYLFLNRYYFSYITISNYLTRYYLYFNILSYFVINFLFNKNKLFRYIFLIILFLFCIYICLDRYIIVSLFIELLVLNLFSKFITVLKLSERLISFLVFSLITKMIITPFMMEFLYNIGFNPLIGDILSTIVCYLMVMLPNLFLVSYHKFGKLEVN